MQQNLFQTVVRQSKRPFCSVFARVELRVFTQKTVSRPLGGAPALSVVSISPALLLAPLCGNLPISDLRNLTGGAASTRESCFCLFDHTASLVSLCLQTEFGDPITSSVNVELGRFPWNEQLQGSRRRSAVEVLQSAIPSAIALARRVFLIIDVALFRSSSSRGVEGNEETATVTVFFNQTRD